jgi:hypothetical protein
MHVYLLSMLHQVKRLLQKKELLLEGALGGSVVNAIRIVRNESMTSLTLANGGS